MKVASITLFVVFLSLLMPHTVCAETPATGTSMEKDSGSNVTDFAGLVELLNRDGVTHQTQMAEQAVLIPTEKGEIDSVLVIRWDSNQQIVHFIQPMTMQVPNDRLREVEHAMLRLNHAMPFPGLGINHDANVAYFRMSVPVDVRGMQVPEIRQRFSQTLALAAKWQPVLKKVVDGTVSASNVVESYNATQFPTGEFLSNVGGAQWKLKFDGEQSVTLSRNGVQVVDSKYDISGSKIRFSDVAGELAVEAPGTYEWLVDNGQLQFRPLEDSSKGRRLVLTTAAWVEQ